jgi:hypothetical protein
LLDPHAMSDLSPAACDLFPVEVQWTDGRWVVSHGRRHVGSYPRQHDALAHVRKLLQELAPDPELDVAQPGDQVSQTSSVDR